MTMKLLDGKLLAEKIRAEAKQEIQTRGLKPGLAAILVGDDPASKLYVSLKEKACKEVGINFSLYKFSAKEKAGDVAAIVEFLNNDPEIHGMIIQLPLPTHLDEDDIIAKMDPTKDADGFHPKNLKMIDAGKPRIIPGLIAGILEFLNSTGENLTNKTAVVVSNSPIFATPLETELKHHNMRSVAINPNEPKVKEWTRKADIVIVAVGKPGWLKADDIKKDAILIDVGITRLPDSTIVGDVDAESVKDKAGYLTPVPGGIGPVTVAMLLKNTVVLATNTKY